MDALRLILCGALCCAAGLALVPAASAKRTVPRGFIGTTMSGPLLDSSFDSAAEADLMAGSGIEAVRIPIYWRVAQPDPAAPISWDASDRLVALAAERGFSIMAVPLQSPPWAAKHPSLVWSPPADPATYARFAAAAVARYGPGGLFWEERPALSPRPIRAWQIWNEPGQGYFWAPKPSARDYVRLLRAARTAIKAADPGARIVLAGLNARSWTAIARIYDAGGGGLFDVAAVHPFTLEVGNVIRTVELVRRAMKRHGGARTPLLVSELSWPTAPRKTYGFEVTEAEQAVKARAALRRLAAVRKRDRIVGVFWETWIGVERDPAASFDWAGLRALDADGPRSKPALATFAEMARRLEGFAP